jgi:diaminohydroxyphosphoribosylaminopyrimidine deaminase/5-amino-6-(5-phosphoribosylamino)uracil reductase
VAAEDGTSQWITGKLARTKVHEWRAQYDAVLIGRNTALLDNPSLTVRHVEGRQPFRIVLDGPDSLPKHLRVFNDQFEAKTIHVVGKQEAGDVVSRMLSVVSGEAEQYKTLVAGLKEGHIDLNETLYQLGNLGIASVMIEAGSELAAAFVRQNLVHKVACFVAPKWLGSGKKVFSDLGITSISNALSLNRVTTEQIGDDLLITGYC